jgi:hypothetical protein
MAIDGLPLTSVGKSAKRVGGFYIYVGLVWVAEAEVMQLIEAVRL